MLQKQIPIKTILRDEEETRTQYTAQKIGLPYLDLRKLSPNPEVIGTLKEADARRESLVVVAKVNDVLTIITPQQIVPSQAKILDDLSKKGWRIKLYLVSRSSFNKAVEYYRFFTPPPPPLSSILIIAKNEIESLKSEVKTLEALKDKIQVIAPNKILKLIVASALSLEASDIHIEPQKHDVMFRLRIDTILQEIVAFKPELYEFLISRIKILSGLKINIKNISQDGRFTIRITEYGGAILKDIDVRVSIIPGGNGEICILRLLGVGIKKLALEELGLTKTHLDKLKFYLNKPNGMILTTGPTGSGKTTTLYSAIQFIKNPKINIVTAEDPIEYRLEGINQSQINQESGYDFAHALRAILRQDPDVILVGEIRDIETAKTAIQAALTGHLVLSTTHTNDAPATISRLKELALDEKEITSSLSVIIAQRLVRKLCNFCKEKYAPAPEELESVKMVLSLISPRARIEIPQDITTLYKAKGCKNCFGLGYRGLLGVYELLEITEEVEKMILAGETSIFKIRTKAMEEGMVTLLQDAILKTCWGVTDLNEVRRVVGDFKYIESLYGQSVASVLTKNLRIRPDTLTDFDEIKTFEGITARLRQTQFDDILESIGAVAVKFRATDIHIEPQEKNILIRLRIDGVLEDIVELPKEEFLPLLSEIKIIAGITGDIAGKTIDGRFKIIAGELSYNVRASIIPGGYGETFVLRILRPDIEKVGFESLGLRSSQIAIIDRVITRTKGMILATGPTSSGKSTTLFSLISKINHPEIKIITIEDPIEYTIKGLVQTQINEAEGYTFAEALRHILRQNPNVILVGEVRDSDTASIALQASLTGHLLLSTLHTIDSFSALDRFKTLGINATDLADSLSLVIAQRLVRKLCDRCKKTISPSAEHLQLINEILAPLKNIAEISPIDITKPVIYTNVGCPNCGPTGFSGQIGVFELLEITEPLQKFIADNTRALDIKNEVKNSVLLMQQDAILKILEGQTTIEEYKRIFG